MSLMPFAARENRLNQSVARHLANATIQLVGGEAVGALYDVVEPSASPFVEVVTVAEHMISVCVNGLGGEVAEGTELILTAASLPPGQLCRITTPVVPDAGGWASFEVVLLSAATTIARDDGHV